MATPQSAILSESGKYGLFLIANVKSNIDQVISACVGLDDMIKENQQTLDSPDLFATVAFGDSFWRLLSPDSKPAELTPFKQKGQGALSLPETGGDLFLHIHSSRKDWNYKLGKTFLESIREDLDMLEEVHGFHYLDDRDLTGFIDGTENPEGDERAEVALIGEEDSAFAGGSYVLAQRYVHNLNKWQKLNDSDQEKIIGRTKEDSVELDDDVQPETSHVSRVVIEEDDEELEILRHSMPYGDVSGDSGLFFLAYNQTLSTYEKMLDNMFGISGDGVHDHLMDFTSAKSSAYFFAPSLEVLNSLKK